jgi:hypothetical protein
VGTVDRTEGQIYRIFVPDFDKFKGHEGEVLEEEIIDENTLEVFKAKIKVSHEPLEGYFPLRLEGSGRSSLILEGQWYVQILERIEEEETTTVFQGLRMGQRRGYMLRSMLQEEKEKAKQELMTKELESRLKKKQELVKELRKKEEGRR